MNTHADKTLENKTQAVANSLSKQQRTNVSAVQFVDNRPIATEQKKLQKALDTSYGIKQLKTYQKKENQTGLPDNLKSGIENLSGISMDNTRVHYNSLQPAQLNAYAFAQGNDIHIGPGQEKHLPHEAWHIVQQKQGRVQAMRQMKIGIAVNDDSKLENEADVMGANATLQHVQLQNKKSDLNSDKQAGIFKVFTQRKVIQFGKATIAKNNSNIDELKGARTHRPDATNFQQQPSVTFATVNLKGDVAGVKMNAKFLGPNHPQGSAPGGAALAHSMAFTQNKTNNYMVRGHLLNGDLGGPGVGENLFPITIQANSHHYQSIESQVKQWVNDNHNYVNYSVDISFNAANKTNQDIEYYDSELTCKAVQVDASGKPVGHEIISKITSEPSKQKGSSTATYSQSLGGSPLHENGLTTNDIEYQSGKMPAEFEEINDALTDTIRDLIPAKNGVARIKAVLKTYGIADSGSEKLYDYINGEAPQDKSTWNTMAKKLQGVDPVDFVDLFNKQSIYLT